MQVIVYNMFVYVFNAFCYVNKEAVLFLKALTPSVTFRFTKVATTAPEVI
jgi:hypothetical protein